MGVLLCFSSVALPVAPGDDITAWRKKSLDSEGLWYAHIRSNSAAQPKSYPLFVTRNPLLILLPAHALADDALAIMLCSSGSKSSFSQAPCATCALVFTRDIISHSSHLLLQVPGQEFYADSKASRKLPIFITSYSHLELCFHGFTTNVFKLSM